MESRIDIAYLFQYIVYSLKTKLSIRNSMEKPHRKAKAMYLTEEIDEKLHKIYATRVLTNRAARKNDVISDAIELLYFTEIIEGKFNGKN
jgi:hypothetical protein